MNQPREPESHSTRQRVLLVSDDAAFLRGVVARWQAEPHVPKITLATSDACHPKSARGHDLAIIGFVCRRRSSILGALSTSQSKPAICLAEDQNDAAMLRSEHPHLLVIPRQGEWTNTLILLASEALLRVHALRRALRAERVAIESQNHAILGRYMLEMRPNINNALTSVLGNADLLLFEPGSGIEETRDQIQTIHTMALRLNEIMQRFSSLDTEMRVGEKISETETNSSAEWFSHKA